MPTQFDISAVKVGARNVNALYLGATKVWPTFTGLLDLYPSAAVAYSLRLLRADYAGAAIRVRRGSDNAEQDIGFVDNVLDTATLMTFIGASDGWVTTWYDQSGLGLDATQTTAAVQPFIVASGVLQTLNGKPCVFINNTGGSNRRRLITPLFHTANVSYLAYFLTYAIPSSGSYPYIIGDAGGSDRGMVLLHLSNTEEIRPATVRAGGVAVENGSALNLNQQYVVTQTANRSRLKAYINNALNIDTGDRNENFIMPADYALGSGNFGGFGPVVFSEFVAYAYDIDAQISAINGNINAFYGAY